MRRNGRLLIVAGVALALVAAVLAVITLSGGGGGNNQPNTTTGNTSPKNITVVQAKKDVEAHKLLTTADLEEVQVSTDTISNPDDAVRSIGEVIGFAYKSNLTSGQRLLRSNLEEPGLANVLAAGSRAVAIPVDKTNLVGGLLREDDRIDITYSVRFTMVRVLPVQPVELAPQQDNLNVEPTLPPYGTQGGPTYPYPGEPGSRFWLSDVEDGEQVSKLVLQNVRVLRVVNADPTAATNQGDYIVVEVDPSQVELVNYMLNQGKYQISLRNGTDTGQVQTTGLNLKDVVLNYGFPIPSTVRLPGPGAQ